MDPAGRWLYAGLSLRIQFKRKCEREGNPCDEALTAALEASGGEMFRTGESEEGERGGPQVTSLRWFRAVLAGPGPAVDYPLEGRGRLLRSGPLRNLCSGCAEQEPELVIKSYLGHRRVGHYQE